MSDPQTQAVLDRIFAALDRIDAASARQPALAPGLPDDGKMSALEARHGKLRQEVDQALRDLDNFITQNQGAAN